MANEYMIINVDGKEIKCNILFTFDIPEYGHNYVVFEHGETKELSAMIFTEKDGTSGNLMLIEDDEEWAAVEEIVNDYFTKKHHHHHGCSCEDCEDGCGCCEDSACNGDCDCDGDHDCDCQHCHE